MRRIEIDRNDLKFFILLGCSNFELAEVFGCSERVIAYRKKEYNLLNLTPNNQTTSVENHTRKCKKCFSILPEEHFSKQISSSQGIRSTCKDCASKEGKLYYKENKEEINERHKKHYNVNKSLYMKKYQKRRAQKKKALPAWYGDFDGFVLEEMYDLCKLKEIMFKKHYEIDHIVPLQGNKVCGLHWYKNWQILTRAENRSKGNKLMEQSI